MDGEEREEAAGCIPPGLSRRQALSILDVLAYYKSDPASLCCVGSLLPNTFLSSSCLRTSLLTSTLLSIP